MAGSTLRPPPATVMGSGCAHYTGGGSGAWSGFRLRTAFNQGDGKLDGLQDTEQKDEDPSNARTAAHKTES